VRRIPIWLTKAEREQLLAQEMSTRNRAILTTFLFGGLRCNELRMLDVADVDFEADTIFIRYAKRDKQRFVPLHSQARDALFTYLGERQSGAVFLSGRGHRISNRRLRSLVKELGQRAGLKKDVHPHTLRHTYATLLREAGVELGDVGNLLGHASLETTRIYDHMSMSRKRAAVDRL
jgi:site-specific recombinase XerD